MNALTLDELALQPADDLLEIGFGGGALLAAAAKATSGRVAGVDTSEAMVANARRRFGSRVEAVCAAADRLPFAAASFDKAAAVNTIYFWADAEAGVVELARVLRPGGRLAISLEPAEQLARWPGHRFGFRLWREDELRALLRKSDFSAIRSAWGTGRKPDRFLCLTGTRRGAEDA